MTKSEAIAHYGGNMSALARALGIHQSSVCTWPEQVPALRQLQLEAITKGALKADPALKKPAPAKAT